MTGDANCVMAELGTYQIHTSPMFSSRLLLTIAAMQAASSCR